MRSKTLIGLAAFALVVLAVSWAAAPVVAAQGLIRAAQEGDVRKLEKLVDFPSLRESLKQELNEELVARMRRDDDLAGTALGGLGLMLAPMLLSGAVDTLVTPEVVAQMVVTARAPDPTRPADPPSEAGGGADLHQSWGYRDLDHFAVTLTDRARPHQRLALIMERRGLFSWKLAAVDIDSGER